MVCKVVTAKEETRLEKEEQKAKSMYERSMYDYVDCEELWEGIVYPKRVNRRGGIKYASLGVGPLYSWRSVW